MANARKRNIWLTWVIISVSISAYYGFRLYSDDKRAFLPGPTSHGHHQIELACAACHRDPFGGGPVLQEACEQCHGAALKASDDSHPKSKFTDPRNADRVKQLDARHCVTCHVEHRPEITHVMGVTLPADVCYNCHADIAKDRPSHKDMAFDTCASAGCHNFHDNRGLNEDFLDKHLAEPDELDTYSMLELDNPAHYLKQTGYPSQRFPLRNLAPVDADAPKDKLARAKPDWFVTSHAKAGVNCNACHLHQDKLSSNAVWTDKPDHTACQQCHANQVNGFLNSLHGMRLAQGLSPMTPAMATLPMQQDAAHKTLTCTSCHRAHRFDTRAASIDACLGCHNDKHSRAYKASAHYKLTKADVTVSCATCHLPRSRHKEFDERFVSVEHNQNANLRPNEKMLRSVCMNCHGLGFAIDALADPLLIENNFFGQPEKHIQSLDMVKRWFKTHKQKTIQ